MAYNELGQSFLPRGGQDSSGPGGNRLEDILQVFSFRLPRILGAKPIAPAQLLNAQGGNDPLASAIVNSVLSNVLKGAPSTMNAAAAPDAGSPSPLSQLMAPMVGPGQSFSTPGGGVPGQGGGMETLRAPTPRIHAIPSPEPPPLVTPERDAPINGPGSGDLNGEFDDIMGQLTRRRFMA